MKDLEEVVGFIARSIINGLQSSGKELQDVTAVDMDATQDDKVIITLEFAKPKEVIQ